MSLRPRPVLWAVTAVTVAVLLALGTWQVQRLQWKNALIAKVEARVGADPVPLDEALATLEAGGDVEYLPVRAVGGFPSMRVAHVFGTLNGAPGAYVFQAMRLDGGERYVIINRGFVPQEERREEYPLPDAEAVTGLARVYEPPEGLAAAVLPEARTEEGIFFSRDPEGMAPYLLEGRSGEVLPLVIDSTLPTELPQGGTTRIAFRNAHLGYALTWYGLAAGLIGVVAVMSRRR